MRVGFEEERVECLQEEHRAVVSQLVDGGDVAPDDGLDVRRASRNRVAASELDESGDVAVVTDE
ncbi:MAG: hypothetical protein ACPHFO_07715 [Acidimicrobiales bacterium]